MGADAVDYDGDGLLDIVKTNFSDEMPSLYHNQGNAFFSDVTAPAGLAGENKTLKWGPRFMDFHYDGPPHIPIFYGLIFPPRPGPHPHPPQTMSKRILFPPLVSLPFS